MQSILMLKTPGGRTLGHVRISGTAGAYALTITGEPQRTAHVVALDAQACVSVTPDAQGSVRIPFAPQALVLLGETGEIAAVAAVNGRETEAALRAQQHARRESGENASTHAPEACAWTENSADQQAVKAIETADALAETSDSQARESGQRDSEERISEEMLSEEIRSGEIRSGEMGSEDGVSHERGESAALPDPFAAQRAWPPPPFFPAAHFKDGAWRT